MNQINAIRPDRKSGFWAFDDPGVGLRREALVAGMPEILVWLAEQAGVSNPEDGFTLLFSAQQFPGADVLARRIGPDGGDRGNTYEIQTPRGPMQGWLCPALYKYFDNAPEVIYAQAMA